MTHPAESLNRRVFGVMAGLLAVMLIVMSFVVNGCGAPSSVYKASIESPIDVNAEATPQPAPTDPDPPTDEVNVLNPEFSLEEDWQYEGPSPVDAALRVILQHPSLASTRDDYGSAGSKEILLINGGAKWPDEELPVLRGYKVHWWRKSELTGAQRPRMLGIRLDKLQVDDRQSENSLGDPEIHVMIWNAGGSKDGDIVGGCNVSINTRKTELGWVAELVEAFDP
jgi:hypothetical protein